MDAIPDETTILNFHRPLEAHSLAEKIFKQVNAHLQRKGLSLRSGTIVDATIINAPSSTKNRDGERDPEMHQTKKGNQWFFGMKAHIGVDDVLGLVHHVECTAANVSDVTQAHKLLHGEEGVVYGDSGYTGFAKREELKDINVVFLIAKKPSVIRAMTHEPDQRAARAWERWKASVRAKVEHSFRVIKRQFGYTKVRYRGVAKNAAQVLTLFALSNDGGGGISASAGRGNLSGGAEKRGIPTGLARFRPSSREITRVRRIVQSFPNGHGDSPPQIMKRLPPCPFPSPLPSPACGRGQG